MDKCTEANLADMVQCSCVELLDKWRQLWHKKLIARLNGSGDEQGEPEPKICVDTNPGLSTRL
eukprot:12069596-Ditylum_brightwellii.AAC.2